MAKQFEIVLPERGVVVAADLLEDETPITCENFWNAIQVPQREPLHHGRETGPELWCYVPPPAEELPYEQATVFPDPGDILYYHYIQPPTRDGVMVFDIGIYYGRGCSKLRQGWIPGNRFARVAERDGIRQLETAAADLLKGSAVDVVLRRKDR